MRARPLPPAPVNKQIPRQTVVSPRHVFGEQEVGRQRRFFFLFRERLIPNIRQLILSKLSPVKFQISHPRAKILQQDDAKVE